MFEKIMEIFAVILVACAMILVIGAIHYIVVGDNKLETAYNDCLKAGHPTYECYAMLKTNNHE